MTWAADAASPKDPGELAGAGCAFIGRYVGTRFQAYGCTRAEIDGYLAAGVGVMLIFEEWASQFLGGLGAGRQMMDRMRASWDALGAPNDGSVIPAIALVDPRPGDVYGHEDALVDFARGIEAGLWLPEWTGYGSRYGLDVVRSSGVAPRLTRRWGVGTWGFGERGDGSLPDDVDADLIQHGNRVAPVAGCDYNTMFRPDMGQWGGPTPAPPTPTRKGQTMIYADPAKHTAILWDGGVITAEYGEPVNEFGIPTAAYDAAKELGLPNPIPNGLVVQKLRDRELREAQNGPPAEDITAITRDVFATETNRRLEADLLQVHDGPGATISVS